MQSLDNYVNEFLDSIDEDDDKTNREKGYYPTTIASWLIHQILNNLTPYKLFSPPSNFKFLFPYFFKYLKKYNLNQSL